MERSRERGLDVSLRVEGDERPLPPGVDLTAYRVIEDALDAATEQGAVAGRACSSAIGPASSSSR